MEIIVGSKKLNAHLTRGRARKTVTAKFLNEQEVELRVPRSMNESEVREFIQSHKKWLERAYKRHLKRKPVFYNSRMLFNGEYLQVEHVLHNEHKIEPIGGSIFVHSPDILALKDTLTRWLEQQTKAYLESKLPIFKQFGVKAVKVKGAKTRWGYCTSKREITFHPFLIALPEPLREYLIYHEIAHLYELNHSWRFKARLEHLMPEYKEREKQLRQYVIT